MTAIFSAFENCKKNHDIYIMMIARDSDPRSFGEETDGGKIVSYSFSLQQVSTLRLFIGDFDLIFFRLFCDKEYPHFRVVRSNKKFAMSQSDKILQLELF